MEELRHAPAQLFFWAAQAERQFGRAKEIQAESESYDVGAFKFWAQAFQEQFGYHGSEKAVLSYGDREDQEKAGNSSRTREAWAHYGILRSMRDAVDLRAKVLRDIARQNHDNR